MRVHVTQLVPGCVVSEDVIGKSNNPVIPKETVLTQRHLHVLHAFLIENINVLTHLDNGEKFTPRKIHDKEELPTLKNEDDVKSLTFVEHYWYVVSKYKEQFTLWKSNVPVDIVYLRDLFLPFLKRIEDIDYALFILPTFIHKNHYRYYHCISVGILSAYLAKRMGYSKNEYVQVGMAGFLCDCGMVKINKSIVEKTSPLTVDEYKRFVQHPTYSYRMIEKLPLLSHAVKQSVLQHHERIDGSGYPFGLQIEKIHEYARILAVSDAYFEKFHTLLFEKDLSFFSIIEKMDQERYICLDNEVVDILIKDLLKYSIGVHVELSNRIRGKIVYVDEKYPISPIIKRDNTDEYISLKEHSDLNIQKVLI